MEISLIKECVENLPEGYIITSAQSDSVVMKTHHGYIVKFEIRHHVDFKRLYVTVKGNGKYSEPVSFAKPERDMQKYIQRAFEGANDTMFEIERSAKRV